MEEQKNNGQPEACTCGWCHGGHRHRHFILRIIFAVIAFAVVFWVGVKVGELKGAFGYRHGGYGRGNFGPRGYYMMRQGMPYPGMMYNGAQGSSTAPAAPRLQQQ